MHTRTGLQAARRQGRVGGRKLQMTDSKIQAARKLFASGTTPHEVAEEQQAQKWTFPRNSMASTLI
jgi:DNA invertase Pin-like site-specific DNA recombinase